MAKIPRPAKPPPRTFAVMNNRTHWNQVYHTKTAEQMSWTQDVPHISLDFIDALHVPTNARIIDVGGGDSRLVDYLLEKGYADLTVLDISEEALDRAKVRLGDRLTWSNGLCRTLQNFDPSIRMIYGTTG